jgi:hypothetical protein
MTLQGVPIPADYEFVVFYSWFQSHHSASNYTSPYLPSLRMIADGGRKSRDLGRQAMARDIGCPLESAARESTALATMDESRCGRPWQGTQCDILILWPGTSSLLLQATNALAHPAYDYVLVRQGWAILYFGILVSLASGQGHELEPALGAGPPTACTIFLVARSASLTSTMQHFGSYVDASVLALWRDIPKQSCAVPQVRRGLGSAQKAVWDCCVYFTPSFSLRHRIA